MTEADVVFGNPFLAKTEFSAGEHEEQMGALGWPPAESTACLSVETSSSGDGEQGFPARGGHATCIWRLPECL